MEGAVAASPKPIVLFIDEAHTLIGAGGAAGTGDAANLLKPALARGALRTIAAMTWAEYKKHNCAGTTVASMDVGSLQSAHNNQKAQVRLDSRLAPGGDSAVRSGEKTPLCEGSSYKHPAPAMQKSGHAEARLMAGISSAPPSRITAQHRLAA